MSEFSEIIIDMKQTVEQILDKCISTIELCKDKPSRYEDALLEYKTTRLMLRKLPSVLVFRVTYGVSWMMIYNEQINLHAGECELRRPWMDMETNGLGSIKDQMTGLMKVLELYFNALEEIERMDSVGMIATNLQDFSPDINSYQKRFEDAYLSRLKIKSKLIVDDSISFKELARAGFAWFDNMDNSEDFRCFLQMLENADDRREFLAKHVSDSEDESDDIQKDDE